jgi:hypothetical protein
MEKESVKDLKEVAIKVLKDEEKLQPKFDPNKSYKWDKDETFVLTANEFGAVLNGLRAALSTAEAHAVLSASRAANVMELLLQKAVENGVAVEQELPKS